VNVGEETASANGRIVMIICSATRRYLLLASIIGTLAAVVSPAAGQQPLASPEAPPPWAQGRPQTAIGANLAPIPTPPLPTAADKLPIAKLKVPSGFKIEVYASGLANARSLREGDRGTVFVSTRLSDKVYAITDQAGRREVKTLYSGLYRPNGLAFANGTLYIGELSKISKVEKIEDNLDNAPKPVVIYDDLPKDEAHGWKFLTIGPDNKLYFNVGAPCNICMPSPDHAQLRRINLDGSSPEVVARGIRQVVGMDWHPALRQLYFTENSRDWLSEDIPEDKLNRLAQPGKDNFGFPYCHQGNVPDQEFGWGRSCDEFTKPITLLGPHAAPLGMRFYTGTMFPSEYRNAIFVARHGSWNRSKKFGGDIVLVSLNENGTVKSVDPFIAGFIENNNYLGRPADVLVLKDGSMLISDDFNGAVYRVTYDGASVGR
jgi:glucose/arabinose dehydrogenase